MNEVRFKADALTVRVFDNRAMLGAEAARGAAEALIETLGRQDAARIVVASAPSQNELMEGLAAAPGIDWRRVVVFHLDEYVGLPASHPASFRAFQERTFLSRAHPASFHGIHGETNEPKLECERYAALLAGAPIDLVCLGIGENGHIAFNDPGVADFDDPRKVKVVQLDEACRRQQVHDGGFPNLDSVPREAITLTCPAIMAARRVVCVVPGPRKAGAVAAAVEGPVAQSCPASILRTHPAATLFLDRESAGNLKDTGFTQI